MDTPISITVALQTNAILVSPRYSSVSLVWIIHSFNMFQRWKRHRISANDSTLFILIKPWIDFTSATPLLCRSSRCLVQWILLITFQGKASGQLNVKVLHGSEGCECAWGRCFSPLTISFIEWRSTIHRFPPPPKIVKQKVKSNQ